MCEIEPRRMWSSANLRNALKAHGVGTCRGRQFLTNVPSIRLQTTGFLLPPHTTLLKVAQSFAGIRLRTKDKAGPPSIDFPPSTASLLYLAITVSSCSSQVRRSSSWCSGLYPLGLGDLISGPELFPVICWSHIITDDFEDPNYEL